MATGVQFNGTSTYITFPTTGLPLNVGTMEVRFNSASTAAEKGLLDLGDTGAGQKHCLYVAAGGGLRYYVSGSEVQLQAISTSTNYLASASFFNNTQLTYLDGLWKISGTLTNATSYGVAQIGRYNSAYFFSGVISEVRIWTSVQSPEQVLLYSKRKLLGNEDGLCCYFDFSEGTGSTLTDKVGGRIGTINNGSWVTSAPDLLTGSPRTILGGLI